MNAIPKYQEYVQKLLAVMGPNELVVQRTFLPPTGADHKPLPIEIFSLTSARDENLKPQGRKRRLRPRPGSLRAENQRDSRMEHG